MKILAVGGGSGGHVTPIAAVIAELRKLDPSIECEVWCDKAFYDQTRHTIDNVDTSIPVTTIVSGKFRRYHGISFLGHLVRLRTIVLPNLIDSFKIASGTVQSIYRLLRNKPDVIFCKGGFVCLPVGLAARLLRIPVVLHDSDAHPGLTNRILSHQAVAIATGAPLERYDYPKDRTQFVGVPVQSRFKPYDKAERASFKDALGFNPNKPLIVVTGGGLGAGAINDSIVSILDELLASCNVLLISGSGQFKQLSKKLHKYDSSRFQLHAFLSKNMVEAMAAADLVITRAGATTLLELAALAKPTILVPNPNLVADHQTKNAKDYGTHRASVIIDEVRLVAQPHELLDTVNALILNPKELERMSLAIHEFARPEAAHDVARMIVDAIDS